MRGWRTSIPPQVANSLWCLSCLPEAMRFRQSSRNVALAQWRVLQKLLQGNAQTEYGERYGFASIGSVTEFQSRVPLTDYEDYTSWIGLIGRGDTRVLTVEPVTLFEPTSGSSAATKLIPYTTSLKAGFQRAIAAWIVDLFTNDPRLLGGQAYWSVTPVVRRNEQTTGGIPIGFEQETDYLSSWQHALLDTILAVPSAVRLVGEMEAFRYVTLLFLLRSRTLTVISIWNPTFLSLLVASLTDWWPQLVADIARGTLSVPAGIAEDVHEQLCARNQPDERRARELTTIFQVAVTPGERHARLWPKLRLISCWADAHAAAYAKELAGLFPHARIQGKGLLATEGFVSFPLTGYDGAALAVRSHFFEFIPIAESATEPRLAHELRAGERYAVVLTTGGGLYRYRLHDVIEVTGFRATCPLMRFVGKEDHVVDWFGEKLNALHVAQVIATVLKDSGIVPAFVMLACETECSPPAYTLFLEAHDVTDEVSRRIGADVEAGLWENYHYRYCRELGQLAEVRVFRIEGGAAANYLSTCQALGQRAGDIKPVVLHKSDGWARVFRGRWSLAGDRSSPGRVE